MAEQRTKVRAAAAERLGRAEYDRELMLSLLRDNQRCLPSEADWALVAPALLLARVHQATFDNDFALLCCLASEQQHATPEMRWLQRFDDCLSTAKFQFAWPLLADLAASAASTPLGAYYAKHKARVDEALVRSVLAAVALTFSQLETAAVISFTNVKVADLERVGKGIVAKATDALVTFVSSDANQPPASAAPRTMTTADVAALAKTILAA
jgi:hypothetical protein